MESTREQILRYVRGRRETTVAQLAESLHLSQQAVRRHLDGLRADGLVDVRQERHGVGRPTLLFYTTERGEELAGRTYLQMLTRLFKHMEKLDASQVSGADGKQVLELVFSGIATEMYGPWSPSFPGPCYRNDSTPGILINGQPPPQNL